MAGTFGQAGMTFGQEGATFGNFEAPQPPATWRHIDASGGASSIDAASGAASSIDASAGAATGRWEGA